MSTPTDAQRRDEQGEDHRIDLGGPPARHRGSRTLVNFWLDVALLMAIIVVLWVSFMLQMVFPRPTAADGWELWGLSFNQWREVQFVGLCICALLALEHLVLHWNWVCTVIATRLLRVEKRPDEAIQAMYGVGAFITVLFLMLGTIFAASMAVKIPKP